jgi:hypothetical protein
LEAQNVKIIFAGGICNLTELLHAGGMKIASHRSDDKIKCLMEEYDSISEYFNSHNVPIYLFEMFCFSVSAYPQVLKDLEKLKSLYFLIKTGGIGAKYMGTL